MTVLREARGSDGCEAGTTGGCEPPNVDSGFLRTLRSEQLGSLNHWSSLPPFPSLKRW